MEGSSVSTFSKYKILFVDDEQNVLKALKRALRSLDCAVVLANNGADALARLAADSYALVLTDMRMPVMDGLDMIEELRKQSLASQVPIVMITSEQGEDLKERARKLGVAEWITKPFGKELLNDTVKKFLS